MLPSVDFGHLHDHARHGDATRLVAVFDALSEPNRCQLFRVLLQGGAVGVGDLARIVGISDPLASQHLKTLRQANLVARQKEGKYVYYRVNHANPMVGALERVVNS